MAENVNSKDQDHCSRLLVEVISTIEFSKSPPSNSAPSLETLQKTSEGCSSSSMIPEKNIDSDEYLNDSYYNSRNEFNRLDSSQNDEDPWI